jgi:hypothetical protein
MDRSGQARADRGASSKPVTTTNRYPVGARTAFRHLLCQIAQRRIKFLPFGMPASVATATAAPMIADRWQPTGYLVPLGLIKAAPRAARRRAAFPRGL